MFYILNKEVQESYEGLGDYILKVSTDINEKIEKDKKEKEEAQNIKKEEEERILYERLKSKYEQCLLNLLKKLP